MGVTGHPRVLLARGRGTAGVGVQPRSNMRPHPRSSLARVERQFALWAFAARRLQRPGGRVAAEHRLRPFRMVSQWPGDGAEETSFGE